MLRGWQVNTTRCNNILEAYVLPRVMNSRVVLASEVPLIRWRTADNTLYTPRTSQGLSRGVVLQLRLPARRRIYWSLFTFLMAMAILKCNGAVVRAGYIVVYMVMIDDADFCSVACLPPANRCCWLKGRLAPRRYRSSRCQKLIVVPNRAGVKLAM
ncbi:hypothetical protein F5B22DRAFT_440308 [Xylaria bambusicola]|uniref:uncharacterized protein n=1 Tax=Xylaria bambusicola TaxID=326684 RepID=UPI0020085F56|nr:uncharacterized protein F5B22DRAFT_440308 [Xylaria bambusicola]KAI0506698.1 hypothetical protein F5B22DRAFT_440308 [Xylaria bambusicola]